MQAASGCAKCLLKAEIDHRLWHPQRWDEPPVPARIRDHRDKIRFVLARHEQAASIMADVPMAA